MPKNHFIIDTSSVRLRHLCTHGTKWDIRSLKLLKTVVWWIFFRCVTTKFQYWYIKNLEGLSSWAHPSWIISQMLHIANVILPLFRKYIESNIHACERAIVELFIDSGSKFNGEHESEVKNVVPSEFGAWMGGRKFRNYMKIRKSPATVALMVFCAPYQAEGG